MAYMLKGMFSLAVLYKSTENTLAIISFIYECSRLLFCAPREGGRCDYKNQTNQKPNPPAQTKPNALFKKPEQLKSLFMPLSRALFPEGWKKARYFTDPSNSPIFTLYAPQPQLE